MNAIVFNLIVAGLAGLGSAIVGYLGNIKQQDFSWFKFTQTILIGVVGGGVVGVTANSWELAIAAALASDDVRGAIGNLNK